MKKTILFLLLAFPLSAFAQMNLQDGTNTTVTTVATKIADEDLGRKALYIENKGTASKVCYGKTAAVTVLTGTCLAPATATQVGGISTFDAKVPTSAIYAISASGSNVVNVQKGN